MKAEVVSFSVSATARSAIRRPFGLATSLATGKAVSFRRSDAAGHRNGSPGKFTKQGNAEGKRSLPNPRLQQRAGRRACAIDLWGSSSCRVSRRKGNRRAAEALR